MVEGKRKKGIIFNHSSISTELKVVRSSKQDASHRTIKEMCIFFFSFNSNSRNAVRENKAV